jgi:hypothetical protein
MSFRWYFLYIMHFDLSCGWFDMFWKYLYAPPWIWRYTFLRMDRGLYLEDGGSKFLLNAGNYLQGYVSSQPRRSHFHLRDMSEFVVVSCDGSSLTRGLSSIQGNLLHVWGTWCVRWDSISVQVKGIVRRKSFPLITVVILLVLYSWKTCQTKWWYRFSNIWCDSLPTAGRIFRIRCLRYWVSDITAYELPQKNDRYWTLQKKK